MISLRKITLENRREVFRLKVADTNAALLHPTSQVLLRVMFLPPMEVDHFLLQFMLMNRWELPKIANNNYCILRLMIGEQYQKRGYGRL